jgi:hypothetical protein
VADTRASATLARLHRDDLLVIHGANLAHFCADAARSATPIRAKAP